MPKNAELPKRPVWLLCEGKDCYWFFIRVLEKLEMENIYCHDVNGIKDKEAFKKVALASNYQNAKVVIYVRDAEYPESTSGDNAYTPHYNSVKQSIQSRFKSIGLSVGDKPLGLINTGSKRAGYIILTDRNGSVGTLEDLCLDMALDADAVDDAASTVECVNSKRNDKVNKHIHKRKLHIAFALNEKENMVGAKTGEAVTNGGLDLDHDQFKPIKDFLAKLNEQR